MAYDIKKTKHNTIWLHEVEIEPHRTCGAT